MQTDERARKNTQVILQAMAETTLEPIARAINRDVSTVCRMKEGDVQRFAALLSVCGLKVVPHHYRCAKPEIIEAAMVFARAAMNSNDHNQLIWDD